MEIVPPTTESTNVIDITTEGSVNDVLQHVVKDQELFSNVFIVGIHKTGGLSISCSKTSVLEFVMIKYFVDRFVRKMFD